MDVKFLNTLTMVSQAISNDELVRLRIEEELLIHLIKNPERDMHIKAEAFVRLRLVNERQMKLLGG
jgi:hypothetical protein